MEISELRIGMLLDLNYNYFCFACSGRVEAVGYDWVVIRDEKGIIQIGDQHINYELYDGEYYL